MSSKCSFPPAELQLFKLIRSSGVKKKNGKRRASGKKKFRNFRKSASYALQTLHQAPLECSAFIRVHVFAICTGLLSFLRGTHRYRIFAFAMV